MATNDCPSCGTETAPGALACDRCGRRLAWGDATPASRSSTLFGEESRAEAPWGVGDREPHEDEAAGDEARAAARSALAAGIAGLVIAAAAVRVFAMRDGALPDVAAADYAAQYERWVASHSALVVGRVVVMLIAAGLGSFALVRGIAARNTLVQMGVPAGTASVLAPPLLGAAVVLVLLVAILIYRPF